MPSDVVLLVSNVRAAIYAYTLYTLSSYRTDVVIGSLSFWAMRLLKDACAVP